MRNIATKWL